MNLANSLSQNTATLPTVSSSWLGVVHSVCAFHQYLLDKPIKLHTDNASLQWLNRQRLVSHHHAQWLDTIGIFAFTIIHIPGPTNPADFLSHMRFSSWP